MGLADQVHVGVAQRLVAGVDVGDLEVEDGGRGVGLEQQAGVAEVEEGQPGRIEPGHEPQPERVAVEGDGPVEVVGVLGDLVESRRWSHGLYSR